MDGGAIIEETIDKMESFQVVEVEETKVHSNLKLTKS